MEINATLDWRPFGKGSKYIDKYNRELMYIVSFKNWAEL